MKCHYEVLNVPRDADLAEIKSAYKKLALKWHPDKNLDKQEDAKEQFQLVQQAYEVLSDRQERAWYDNHREQILRGSNTEFQDNSLDVFQYFTSTCFKGYGDDNNGFYSVYRNVFEKIAKEDLEFMENKDEYCGIPSFGNSQSDYDEVVKPFYDYWMSYSTKKSFVWLDPYNINEIRDRRSLKLAEKENKKVRQQARKERNEEVRALVAFVRKRDKRVEAHLLVLEAKRLENKQKVEQLRLQKKLERNAELSRESAEADWAKFDNVKSELREIEKNLAKQFSEELSNSEEEEDENNLYCVACNKVFKTEKTFKNHELSKKHKENVAILKETMLNEEEPSTGHESISGEETAMQQDDNSISDDDEEESSRSKKKNKKSKNKILATISLEEIEPTVLNDVRSNVSDSDHDFDSAKQRKKKSKRSTNKKAKAEAPLENGIETKTKKHAPKQQDAPVDTSHCCVSCNSSFSSKNKLFDHLKKSGHSVHLPNSKAAKSIKQKKNS